VNGKMSTKTKYCPKCSLKDLSSFCAEATKQLEGGPKVTSEEWDKTHKIPEMVYCGDFVSRSGHLEIDAYRCPVCHYVEFWG
jgi:ribosomal protein S27AE